MSDKLAPDLAARIDALLPQTQCTRCGYPGCAPYAAAIARGEAEINQCPPGGLAAIEALARLLNRPVLPLNPDNGVEGPARVAWIDESRCIVVSQKRNNCVAHARPHPVDDPGHTELHTAGAKIRKDVQEVRAVFHSDN